MSGGKRRNPGVRKKHSQKKGARDERNEKRTRRELERSSRN
jgi:hypothetical protein